MSAPAAEGLPDFAEDPEVPPEAAEGFRAHGHTVLRGLASPAEVAAYRPVIEEVALRHAREKRPLAKRDTYGQAFLQVPNLWRVDARVARFVLARRFARAAAALLGAPAVRLYHDQALFKEPGGGRTPWHQDQFYWPLEDGRTITLWMPLADVPAEVGSMTFASGSHRLGDLGARHISDSSDAHYEAVVAERGLPLQTHGPLAAGDATFHAGWTLHRAPANPTSRMRPVMTMIYFADGLRVAEPQHAAQRFDLHLWLPGLAPGDLAASPLNPRLGV